MEEVAAKSVGRADILHNLHYNLQLWRSVDFSGCIIMPIM
jgi:hypothetical protein